MTVTVELVPSDKRTADGKKMFDVVPTEPYDQSPKPHGKAGNHNRYKSQQNGTVKFEVSSKDNSRYTPNPTY